MRKYILGSIIILVGYTVPASAEVLYLECTSMESTKHWKEYLTIDLSRRQIQYSPEQAGDNIKWERAEITDTNIKWRNPAATFDFNRYSGNLAINAGIPNVIKCARTEPPKRKY